MAPARLRAATGVVLLLGLVLAGCTSSPGDGQGGGGGGGGNEAPAPTQRPEPGFHPLVLLRTDLGDIWIEVYDQMVPGIATAFLEFARSGFLEGTKFYGILHGGFLNAGDPATRDPTVSRDQWGQDDPNLPRLRDEYHPELRYDSAGMVGMVRRTPDGSASRFYIMLKEMPHLNDQSPAFGRVVAGMPVAEAIDKVPTDARGVPVEDIVIRKTEVVEAVRPAEDIRHGLRAWTYPVVYNTTAGHTTQFAVVVENTGNVIAEVNATLGLPPGWTGSDFYPRNFGRLGLDRTVPAGASDLWMFHARVSPNATFGMQHIRVTFTDLNGSEASTTVPVRVGTLGLQAQSGDSVGTHYIGLLPDGRMFDTSRYEVALNDSIPVMANIGQVRPEHFYTPLVFQVDGTQVIPGFSEGARNLREGEVRVFPIAPDKAYPKDATGPRGDLHLLAGRPLVFLMDLVRLER